MNYYQFHIGDYASHTRGLSLMEDLAYRRLLDLYYLRESPISATKSTTVQRPFNDRSTDVARMIGMRDQIDAVRYILMNFFEENEAGEWENHRANEEILAFKLKKNAASEAGKISALKRKSAVKPEKFNDRSTTVQRPFNQSTTVQPINDRSTSQEPLTNNQNIKRDKSLYSVHPDGLNDEGAYLENLPVELSKDPGQVELSGKTGQLTKLAKKQLEISQEQAFEVFWQSYPKKQAKKTAFKAWQKIKPIPTMDDAAKLAQIVQEHAKTAQWMKDRGEFIPMASTWLNNRRWEDDLSAIHVDEYAYSGNW